MLGLCSKWIRRDDFCLHGTWRQQETGRFRRMWRSWLCGRSERPWSNTHREDGPFAHAHHSSMCECLVVEVVGVEVGGGGGFHLPSVTNCPSDWGQLDEWMDGHLQDMWLLMPHKPFKPRGLSSALIVDWQLAYSSLTTSGAHTHTHTHTHTHNGITLLVKAFSPQKFFLFSGSLTGHLVLISIEHPAAAAAAAAAAAPSTLNAPP